MDKWAWERGLIMREEKKEKIVCPGTLLSPTAIVVDRTIALTMTKIIVWTMRAMCVSVCMHIHTILEILCTGTAEHKTKIESKKDDDKNNKNLKQKQQQRPKKRNKRTQARTHSSLYNNIICPRYLCVRISVCIMCVTHVMRTTYSARQPTGNKIMYDGSCERLSLDISFGWMLLSHEWFAGALAIIIWVRAQSKENNTGGSERTSDE